MLVDTDRGQSAGLAVDLKEVDALPIARRLIHLAGTNDRQRRAIGAHISDERPRCRTRLGVP